MARQQNRVCPHCQSKIEKGTRRCPFCHKRIWRNSPVRIIVIVVIAFFVFLILVGSIGSYRSSHRGTEETVITEETASDLESSISDESETYETKKELAIDEAVIYEGYDTIVKTTGEVRDSLSYVQIELYFENNSNLNLDYCIHSYAVNGIMAEESYYVSSTNVVAGKKASNTLDISKSWLSKNGIDEIQYIDILFWAYDEDILFKSFESNIVRIETNLFNGTVDHPEGTELYSSPRLTVKLLSLDDNSIRFSVTDKSDEYFDFDIKNVSINDWTYDPGIDIYNEEILPSCTGIYELKFDSDFKETNSITTVSEVEFSLAVRPLGDFRNESSTDPMIARRE